MSEFLFENIHITPAFQPQTGGAIQGDWVSLKGYDGVLILVYEMRGAEATGSVYTVDKATSVAGADVSTGITMNNFWYVQDIPSTTGDVGGTAAATVGATDTWTKGTAAATWTGDTSQSIGQLWACEIKAHELPCTTAGVFTAHDCVQVNVTANAAHTLAGVYILYAARYGQDLTDSAIAD